MRRITHLILHCSDNDRSTVESMTRFHKLVNGWRDIGYHKIGYPDGSLHQGRLDTTPGAGVLGFNATTLHYCMVGKLSEHPPTTPQYWRAVAQFVDWCRIHDLDPEVAILGHRETVSYVPKIMRTRKQCPGKFVDMRQFRANVKAELNANQ